MMAEFEIPRAVFLGTSMGGLITMTLMALRPRAIAAAILNDVGPEIAPEGIARILSYAIWLHDLFYDVKAPDNERRSADIGLALLQWPEDEMRDLELCVMATKGHATDHPLARILVDLDLSILAAAREGYRRYALAVRDEYRLYPDEAYRQGRIRVLDHLCEAPLLRLVSLAKGLAEDELGQRACANMRWEQERLRDSDGTIEAALAGD